MILTPAQQRTIRNLATAETERYAAKQESGKALTSNDEKRFDFADFSLRLLRHNDAVVERVEQILLGGYDCGCCSEALSFLVDLAQQERK